MSVLSVIKLIEKQLKVSSSRRTIIFLSTHLKKQPHCAVKGSRSFSALLFYLENSQVMAAFSTLRTQNESYLFSAYNFMLY